MSILLLARKKHFNILQLFENFDSFALIHIGWFDKPNILVTMLLWNMLFIEFLLGYVLKALDQVMVFLIFNTSCNDKGSGN